MQFSFQHTDNGSHVNGGKIYLFHNYIAFLQRKKSKQFIFGKFDLIIYFQGNNFPGDMYQGG